MNEGSAPNPNWHLEQIKAAGKVGILGKRFLCILSKVSTGNYIDPSTLETLKEYICCVCDETRLHIATLFEYQRLVAIKEAFLEESAETNKPSELKRFFLTLLTDMSDEELLGLLNILKLHTTKDENWVKTCTTTLLLLQKSAKNNPITGQAFRKLRTETFKRGKELGITRSSERLPKMNSSPAPQLQKPPESYPTPFPPQKTPSQEINPEYLDLTASRIAEEGFEKAFIRENGHKY